MSQKSAAGKVGHAVGKTSEALQCRKGGATDRPRREGRSKDEAEPEKGQKVKGNKGSPGVEGMTVDELPEHLKQHGLKIGEQLRNGTYQPQPVRRVEIPKPDGQGVRQLGIPCVLDRFVQQAVLQVLQKRWDP